MTTRLLAMLVVSLGAMLAGAAHAAVPVKTANGVTPYTFDEAVAGSGKSTCNGACGPRQWAYKGKPVYL